MDDPEIRSYDPTVQTIKANSAFFQIEATIPGLPEQLRVVPIDPNKWRMWNMSVRAYREKRRRECARDLRQQAIEYEKCRRDPCYFTIMFGVIFEARSVEGTPPSWKPFILFHFQVQMIRSLEHMMTLTERGRGDMIWEKSRDMGATNVICAFAVHHFIFEKVFICGFISRNFDAVYKRNSSDTIFYKITAFLGIEDAVPAELRLPKFLQPRGFDPEIHISAASIKNPEPGKTCFLLGETTTKLTGVSGRSTLRVNDEAARFDAFHDAWANQQATTDHRLALSSADTRSPAFYNLARLGEQCLLDPHKAGPMFMRLEWRLHPFHTQTWYENQRDRAMADGDPYKFAREYDIDYFAGQGDPVYPRYLNVKTTVCPYEPEGGTLYCFIDPGIRDAASIIFVQKDSKYPNVYNVIDSFEGLGGEDAGFYASVLTGVYLSGMNQYDYNRYNGIHQFMEFTSNIRQAIIYVGDPAGNQRGAGGEESETWFKKLNEKAMEFSGRSIIVHTVTHIKTPGIETGGVRSFTHRINCVNELLPQFQFDSRGGDRTLKCLQQAKYPRPTRTESVEPMKPIHDKNSHIRTAFEWGCVWLAAQKIVENRGVVVAVRQSMSGNRVNAATKEESFFGIKNM